MGDGGILLIFNYFSLFYWVLCFIKRLVVLIFVKMSKIAGNFYELTSLFYKFIENELCRNFDRFICTETDSSQNCHFQGKRCNPLDSGRWVDCCEFFHLLRRHSAEMFDNALVNCTHTVRIYFSFVNLLAQLFFFIEENKNDT